MFILEKAHKAKRKIIKTYKTYFTIEHPETYILSDKTFIKKIYKKRMGKDLNLSNPKTFCEKQNWLKLYDRQPIYTVMVDKYLARDFVAERIGDEYLVPLLGVWNNANDIDFSSLPDKFVLKCNHNSDVTICTDKSTLDVEKVRKKLNEQLSTDYYTHKREWPYKNIPRKIICEKFMENTNGEDLVDYKLFCFNGTPKFVMVNSNRFGDGGVKVDMYDMQWNHMDMQDGHYPNAGDIFIKPDCFNEICALAENLSKGTHSLRVDFNYWDNKLYFGELTFFHSAGLESFMPEKWDEILGSWVNLPKKHRR
ncbi:MAG: ATP-grasp fold amidoligase family protein [Acutalibacteraceae bacterium]|nr:ATP-grasp fold amidoligase family protein [Acutalibacteraceae bacterium]